MLKRRRAAEGEDAPGSESASDPESSKEAHSDGGDDEEDEEEEDEQDAGPLRDESGPWRCVLCPKALLLGPAGLRQHIESKRHRKRLGNASEGDIPEGGPIINAKAFDRLTARVEAERAAVGGEEAETHAERLERLRSLAKGHKAGDGAGAEEAPGARGEQHNPQAEGKRRRKRRREEGKRPRKG